jgi:hypothetical protein
MPARFAKCGTELTGGWKDRKMEDRVFAEVIEADSKKNLL